LLQFGIMHIKKCLKPDKRQLIVRQDQKLIHILVNHIVLLCTYLVCWIDTIIDINNKKTATFWLADLWTTNEIHLILPGRWLRTPYTVVNDRIRCRLRPCFGKLRYIDRRFFVVSYHQSLTIEFIPKNKLI